MDAPTLLQNIWYILIGVLFLGYSIFDGFDLGIGSLLPVLGRSEEDKKVLLNAIAPFWDGNEVWLLTAGGALFASFPAAYAAVFSGFYLPIMMILFSLIFRAVSIDFFFHDSQRQRIWFWTLAVGSFLPSLLFGVALGNIIQGIPLNGNMDYTGTFFTLLRPLPLVFGLLGLNAILLQGATYTAMKTDGDLQQRTRNLTLKLWASFIILFLLSFVMMLIYAPFGIQKVVAWMGALIVLASWWLLKKFTQKGSDRSAFYMSTLAFVGLWTIIGAVHYPFLVRASNQENLSIQITNASSSPLTLKVMLIVVIIGMPLVLWYTFYVYKTFKGKVTPDEDLY